MVKRMMVKRMIANGKKNIFDHHILKNPNRIPRYQPNDAKASAGIVMRSASLLIYKNLQNVPENEKISESIRYPKYLCLREFDDTYRPSVVRSILLA
jgi:hypothetical protein